MLLATDSMYLMTSLFDWGPCALQHVFLVAVMLTFIRFDETEKTGFLALGSFLAGAALCCSSGSPELCLWPVSSSFRSASGGTSRYAI